MMTPSVRSSHPKYSTDLAARVRASDLMRRRNISRRLGVVMTSAFSQWLRPRGVEHNGQVSRQPSVCKWCSRAPVRFIDGVTPRFAVSGSRELECKVDEATLVPVDLPEVHARPNLPDLIANAARHQRCF